MASSDDSAQAAVSARNLAPQCRLTAELRDERLAAGSLRLSATLRTENLGVELLRRALGAGATLEGHQDGRVRVLLLGETPGAAARQAAALALRLQRDLRSRTPSLADGSGEAAARPGVLRVCLDPVVAAAGAASPLPSASLDDLEWGDIALAPGLERLLGAEFELQPPPAGGAGLTLLRGRLPGLRRSPSPWTSLPSPAPAPPAPAPESSRRRLPTPPWLQALARAAVPGSAAPERASDWGTESLPSLPPGLASGPEERSRTLAPGLVFEGRYRIEEALGRGATGSVYQAWDLVLDRRVAIKLMAAHLMETDAAREQFLGEARVLARLSCPQILRIHSVGLVADRPYLALEFVAGASLLEVLQRRGPLPPCEALDIASEIARGLAVASDSGVIHRDINPRNVLLSHQGEVKIVDFGIALQEHQRPRSTPYALLLGTPLYMAPEQWRGEPLDLRCDIYALGITLDHMLRGEPPFDGETLAAVMMQHLGAPLLPYPTSVGPAAAELHALVARMTAKAAADRFPDYPSLGRALARQRDRCASPPEGSVPR